MSGFEAVLTDLARYLAETADAHAPGAQLPGWPSERTLLLQEDTALELGNPSVGSVACLAWTPELSLATGVHVIGAELADLESSSVALGRFVIVQVDAAGADDEYGRFLELQDALYSAQMQGVTVRARPSLQSVWYRIGRAALADGFSFTHLGAAVRSSLMELDFVDDVAVVLATDPDDDLRQIAEQAGRIVGALVKRNEEDVTECGVCEYSDICEEGSEP